MISQHVRRVDQLDSVSLDASLFTLLNAQYRKAFSYLPSYVVAKTGPELDILFRFIFKYLPLKYLGSTYGQKVFDIKYYDSKTLSPAPINKLRLLAAVSVGFPWVWDRIIRRLLINVFQGEWSHRIFETSYNLEFQLLILWKLLSLFNFCVFLQKSAFPTVTERILRIRPLHSAPEEIKHLQYDGVSRELLWHGLAEFLGFTLPLINVFRIKNYVKRMWFSWSNKNRLRYRSVDSNCLICGSIPNFPHTMGCAHTFCYYCIASMLLVDPSFACVYCNFTASGLNCIKAVPINRPESGN